MPEFVSAYQGDDNNTVVTVSKAFAEGAGLTTLKSDPPLDSRGRPRSAREGNRTSVSSTATASTSTTTGGKAAKEGSDR